MESSQSGLLERLRAQRESMQAAPGAAPPIEEEPGGIVDSPGAAPMPMMPTQTSAAAAAAAAEATAAMREHATRLVRLESESDNVRQRVDTIEANLRSGLAELRAELPAIVTGEVGRVMSTTNEAVADIGGRVGRLESDFTRERERWSNLVTSFDQRLDHRLRSFRQDVTVMLAGMAVLVLAMLMLLLMRR
jgi:hypothetical protein